MVRDPKVLLEDIDRAADEIASFVNGVGFEAYLEIRKKQRAVERCFGIIGEALNGLRQADRKLADQIANLGDAVGFRNLLIHQYFIINPTRVWKSTVDDLPALHQNVRSLLAELESTTETGIDTESGQPDDGDGYDPC